MPADAPRRLAGDVPLVLVAPHGGRRDPARTPWHRGGLRTNDLHTAELTLALARLTGAAAVVNDALDRNAIDCNRLDHLGERHPAFLDAIHDALDRAVARHGRATLLTIHGWNTTAPAIDVGLGCRPGREMGGESPGPAVSRAFGARAVPALRSACARRGITVSIGRRYPARAPQNLIQLFTGRWIDDERAAVARLARFTTTCDAMQLELGIPLRWPGPWRSGFVEALRAAMPALTDPLCARPAPLHDGGSAAEPPASARRLEFVSEGVCGMAAADARGVRLLLLGAHPGLDLFTHDWYDPSASPPGLVLRDANGTRALAYDGPIGRFPTTDAFLDLEGGLAGATVAGARIRLAFRTRHPDDDACPFGSVEGEVVVDGRRIEVHGPAVTTTTDGDGSPFTWLSLGSEQHLSLSGTGDRGLLCDGTRHRWLPCRVTTSERGITVMGDPPDTLRVTVDAEHRIPIVRGRSTPATMVALETYRSGPRRVGWGLRSDASS